MQSPEIEIREIRIGSKQELYDDLIRPFINGERDRISTYRVKQIVQGIGNVSYALYENDHTILAVQFYLDDKPIPFCDNELVQFLSVDEIKLIKELGEITIDGMAFVVESTTFNIIDSMNGCQHIIIFNLKRNY